MYSISTPLDVVVTTVACAVDTDHIQPDSLHEEEEMTVLSMEECPVLLETVLSVNGQ